MSDTQYSFESTSYSEGLHKNIRVFMHKFGLKNIQKGTYEYALISNFCKANIANIQWYRKQLKTENFWRKAYSTVSVILIIFVPIFIYVSTTNIPESESADQQLTYGQNLTSSVIAIITMILALHKLLTSWIEKRKFCALFHQASVDLKNILYKLEADYAEIPGDYSENFHILSEDQLLSDGLTEALQKATVDSRKVVDVETNTYFKTRGNPSFDLSTLLTNSATSAKNLFGLLKNDKLDLKELKDEAKADAEKKETLEDNISDKSLSLNIKLQQLERLSGKEAKLCTKLEPLEELTNPSDEQKVEIKQLNKEYDALQDEIEKVEFECLKLKEEVKHLKTKLK